MGVRGQGSVVWVQCANLCRVCVLNLSIAAPADMGLVRSRSHYEPTIMITCLITTLVRWWKKLVDIYVIVRGSLWYQEYQLVGYLGCYAKVKGNGQAPCGHEWLLRYCNTKFDWILRWSCDVHDGYEVPEQSKLVHDNVIMLHGSVIMFIWSCHARIVLAASCCSWHVFLIISC